MKDVSVSDIRSFALVGHQGCGKTSLAEAILFNTKAVHKLGSVDGKSTVMDFEEDEQERGGSINMSVASCEYSGPSRGMRAWNARASNVPCTSQMSRFSGRKRRSVMTSKF